MEFYIDLFMMLTKTIIIIKAYATKTLRNKKQI